MGGTGWSNPFPLEMGGGPTEIERTYQMLRSAVGKGGASTDDDSIEAIWRQSKAKGIGLVGTFDERAALQAFPNLATDLIPYYERLLISPRDPGASDEERRGVTASRFTASSAFLHAEIEADLQLIDSRFEVVIPADDEATTTNFGRAFEDLAGTEPFNGGRSSTLLPNYATQYVFTALLDNGGIALTPLDLRAILAARRHLRVVLPAWMALQVVVGVGFILDTSPLDYTALSP
jgi:hypothetical protein